MSFAGINTVASEVDSERTLPRRDQVAALDVCASAGIEVPGTSLARQHSKRVRMAVSEREDHATATIVEVPDAEIEMQTLAAGAESGAFSGAPGWALAMLQTMGARIDDLGDRVGGVETALARLQNRNVDSPTDTIVPIRGALAPFALPADAIPVVYFPTTLRDLGALSYHQARKEVACSTICSLQMLPPSPPYLSSSSFCFLHTMLLKPCRLRQ